MADFPIVGIGSSAGGLEALEKLFEAMPADAGAAFVVVAHLDPTRESHLTELLRRRTKMPVVEVHGDITVEPNHVYVIAPDQSLEISGDVLHPSRPSEPRAQRRPVDIFFRSLAESHRERAIGIVLSGTGTNGAAGLRFIKAEGGIAIAQDPATAGYAGMPQSAIGTGIVDLVLPPEQMAEALISMVRHPTCASRRRSSSRISTGSCPRCWPSCGRRPISTSNPTGDRRCCAGRTAAWGCTGSGI